jgi:thiol:disulfide interchange protein DsbD
MLTLLQGIRSDFRFWPFAICWLFLVVLSEPAASATSGEGPLVTTANMQTRLLSEFSAIVPGQPFTVAMHQRIRPHWHTYWRNPGDSGEPTDLTWRLPPGWSASEIHWPAPKRIPFGPLLNFGYSDEVLLLVTLQAPEGLKPGAEIQIEADAYWLVCEETCIPEEGVLSLNLKVGETAAPSNWHSRLEAARAALPRTLPWPARLSLGDSRLTIELPVPEGAEIHDAAYFPFHKDVIRNAAEQHLQIESGRLTLTIPSAFAAAPDRLDGVLLLQEQSGEALVERAYQVTPAATPAASPETAPATPPIAWWVAMLMAFAGGLLLNLMPCVFPVLSIKALSLVSLANQQQRRQRGARHAVFYTAGVVLGFLALALLLIGMRGSGEAIGWGFQLQNPTIVLLLAWLFFTIGLNLSGLFSIAGSFSGVGQTLTEGDGSRSSFFTGLLATLVATPCTAPFMGAAMGYALLQPAYLTLLVFLALGIGMAMPMALLSRFPNWLRFLPRPGRWMDRLKEFLAFPMYLSTLWLLWVYQSQTGDQGLLIGGAGLVALALLCWSGRLETTLLRSTSIALSLGALALLLSLSDPGNPASKQADSGKGWQPYSAKRLAEARQDGPVFVNFTADWCITCKVNEQVAMTDEVMTLFDDKGVTRLLADWTSRDPAIARDIELHGRSGVPLYLWYAGIETTEPEILPQLLTEQMLIGRLETLP